MDANHTLRIATATALLAVAGCATLERHPIATAVIAGVVVGVVSANAGHRSPAPGHDVTTQPVICTGGSCK